MALIICLELTSNALYFQKPMDIAMNFAALAVVLELDNVICQVHFFREIKARYNLFTGETYDINVIENIGTIK